MIFIIMEKKKCKKCNQEKEFNEFYKCSSCKDGLRFYCKLCESTQNKSREPKYVELRKKYRDSENYKLIKRNYYIQNKEKVHNSNAVWRQTFKGRLLSYKRGAKLRNIDWLLTEEEFNSFWQKPCYYCNAKIDTIGIDRIDSKDAYVLNNCRPCCSECNKMKMDLDENAFLKKIITIFKNLGFD